MKAITGGVDEAPRFNTYVRPRVMLEVWIHAFDRGREKLTESHSLHVSMRVASQTHLEE